jgi:hypothetical protein
MTVVVVSHFEEKCSPITIRRICVEVLRFPGADVLHEIIAVGQPQLLLPRNDLRRSTEFHHRSGRKSIRYCFVMVVNVRKAVFIE